MKLIQTLHEKREEIVKIAEKHGAFDIRVFGSVSREEETENSDIDILVKTRDKTSPWFPGGLIIDLEKALGRKIKVVTEKGLNVKIRDRILGEAVKI